MFEENNVASNATIQEENQADSTLNQQQEQPEGATEPSATTEKLETKQEKTFTEEQVIEMMKKRVNRSHQAFFDRYHVKDLAELDSAFAKNAEYEKKMAELGLENDNLKKTNAFLQCNIDPARYDDVVAHYKGIDQKVSMETLSELLKTHPEWVKKVVEETTKPKTTFTTLSPEGSHKIEESDEDKKNRIFGKI